MKFHNGLLDIQPHDVIASITKSIREQVGGILRKRGAVVAVSGGIDSAVCAALCTRALGKDHVFALMLPEKTSSPNSLTLGTLLVEFLGIPSIVQDITAIVDAAGCYRFQSEALRSFVPDFDDAWKYKIVIPSILQANRLNISRLVIETSSGETKSVRMPGKAYQQIVAATNFKQRTRKMLEYFHADRLNYAVCGTPNRLEYDQGFFVKLGDGSADFKPIAHLYKTQVYRLAEALAIPLIIRNQLPTTDTFSLAQTQEEFYFSLPYGTMDLCLYAYNHNFPADAVTEATGLSEEQVVRVYHDIDVKRRTTLPHHLPPLLAEDVPEITRLKRSVIAGQGPASSQPS
jgi:NAD+ synthase